MDQIQINKYRNNQNYQNYLLMKNNAKVTNEIMNIMKIMQGKIMETIRENDKNI